MRRSLRIALAVVLLGVPALCVLSTRSVPARVFARNERIHVMPSTGQWYHEYSVVFGVADATASAARAADSVSLIVGRNQFDLSRTGTLVRLNRLAFAPRIAWVSDSASPVQTLRYMVDARIKSYASPAPVSPLQVQMAGLARVVAVHAVQRRKPFWQKSDGPSSDRGWIHLVEVEFWAQRVRSLVRTIDVIDAGSIPGLHAGDIVQMHFDPNDPRLMRLDDGMRTFGGRGR